MGVTELLVITVSCGHNESSKSKLCKVLESLANHVKRGAEKNCNTEILDFLSVPLSMILIGKTIASLNAFSLQFYFFTIIIIFLNCSVLFFQIMLPRSSQFSWSYALGKLFATRNR